jgi:hypothetical protein
VTSPTDYLLGAAVNTPNGPGVVRERSGDGYYIALPDGSQEWFAAESLTAQLVKEVPVADAVRTLTLQWTGDRRREAEEKQKRDEADEVKLRARYAGTAEGRQVLLQQELERIKTELAQLKGQPAPPV